MDETALGPNVVASRPVLFVRAKLRATSRLRSMATRCILNNALSFERTILAVRLLRHAELVAHSSAVDLGLHMQTVARGGPRAIAMPSLAAAINFLPNLLISILHSTSTKCSTGLHVLVTRLHEFLRLSSPLQRDIPLRKSTTPSSIDSARQAERIRNGARQELAEGRARH